MKMSTREGSRRGRVVRRYTTWRLRILVALCCVSGFALGCAVGSGTGAGANGASETEPHSFADDFEDPDSGWPQRGYGGTSAGYVNGAYEMAVGSWENGFAAAPSAHPAAAITVGVDAERVKDFEGETGGIWGVVCGEDLAQGRYYQAVIQVSDGVGFPALARWQDGEPEVFRKADRPDEAITADGVNRLELECVDDGSSVIVVFTVNGEQVARGVDGGGPSVDRWETGLMLDGSPLPAGEELRMRFDNYQVVSAR